ncbi:cell division protein FtsQ [Ruminococcus sp. CLA-AA-H200]|uniref:Cell division protein FtsQ n=1 Tax=Ruminococcus turbiniformis TaxID=2881258 RepID=A0ABS8FXV7_9FIRM|nr:cell division protein FtsQ [Ruminococcus turbiniformis]MCC2254173.1 cell division protein FtsQ [Ruminococcus turbiniformis]
MKKKKHRKRKIWPVVAGVFLAVIVLAAGSVLLFRTRSFEVEGNSYYSKNTITSWIQNDQFSFNTLYILIKYNFTDADLPSAVESMDVSLKNPWTVRVKVTEKEMAGYVDYDNAYLYFDRNGNAVLRTPRVLEGVPYIEGLVFDAEKVEIGSALPVEDDSVFDKIVEVSKSLKKFSLTPDRISCADGTIHLFFGGVEVLLGSGDYDVKLEQAQAVMEKLLELYPDTPGTLHLENYDPDSGSIRFVPAA